MNFGAAKPTRNPLADAATYFHSASERSLPAVLIDRGAAPTVHLIGQNTEPRQPRAGGLLLGRISPGTGSSIIVSKFQSLPWDASRGGAPFLAPVHEKVLDQQLRRMKFQPDGLLAVIGFWRTARAGETTPSEQDWILLQQYFGDREPAILLLVSPVSPSASICSVFFHGFDGLPESAVLELLLEASVERPPGVTLAPALLPLAQAARRWSPLWLAGVLLLFAALLSRMNSRSDRTESAGATTKPRLELQVTRVGSDFAVLWARNSASGKAFTRGKLTIEDSGTRKEFLLNRAQMSGARMLYQPLSGDVVFQLEGVTDDDQMTVESVRAYQALPPTSAPTPATLMETIGVTPPPQVTVDVAGVVGNSEQRARGSVWNEGRGAIRQQSRLYQVVAPPQSAAPVIHMPEPPQLKGAADLPRQPLFELSAERLPGAPIPPWDPQPAISRESRTTPESMAAPRTREAVARQTSAPVAIHSPKPAFNRQISAMLSGPAEVVVHVKIDEHGRVVEATADASSAFSLAILKHASITAAKNWRFQPATIDGKPVPSETDLRFRFVR